MNKMYITNEDGQVSESYETNKTCYIVVIYDGFIQLEKLYFDTLQEAKQYCIDFYNKDKESNCEGVLCEIYQKVMRLNVIQEERGLTPVFEKIEYAE